MNYYKVDYIIEATSLETLHIYSQYKDSWDETNRTSITEIYLHEVPYVQRG